MGQTRNIISFDYAIKTVLRNPANFNVLSGFLTELLGKKIEVQSLMESESNTADPKGKINRLDLKAKIDNDEIAIFEVQIGEQIDFFKRILFGVSKATTEQIHKGDAYEKIKKVYSIDIVYFELGKGTDYIYHGTTDFKGLHNNETLLFSPVEESLLPDKPVGEIFPEYYLIYPRHFNEEIKTKFDEWVYVLKTSKVMADFSAAGVQEAGEALDELKMTPAEHNDYENYIKFWRVYRSMVDTAAKKALAEGMEKGIAEGEEKGMAKGMEKGLAKGMEKGMEKGRAEGIAKGREEGRAEGELIGEARGIDKGKVEEKREIARNLKQKNIPIAIIAESTGLSEKEIEGL